MCGQLILQVERISLSCIRTHNWLAEHTSISDLKRRMEAKEDGTDVAEWNPAQGIVNSRGLFIKRSFWVLPMGASPRYDAFSTKLRSGLGADFCNEALLILMFAMQYVLIIN
jgi:hypothetical protein